MRTHQAVEEQPNDETLKELELNVEWNWREKYPMQVFLQGKAENIADLSKLREKLVILTIHDVGENPLSSFIPMAESKWLAKLRGQGAVFLHVCIPGQEYGAEDFIWDYPTMEHLAEILPQVLDQTGVGKCIAIGEGAGADVVCRFAFLFPEMLEGIILIHCTSTPHGFFENLKEMFSNLHIHKSEMNEEAWEYLLAHKFGEHGQRERKALFMEQIRQAGLNENNVGKYLYSFSCRADFSSMLKKLKILSILLTGSKSTHNKNVFHIFEHMDKTNSSMLVAENAQDVLKEAPEYVAQAINHICQQHKHLANIVLKICDESPSATVDHDGIGTDDETVIADGGEEESKVVEKRQKEEEEEKPLAKAVDNKKQALDKPTKANGNFPRPKANGTGADDGLGRHESSASKLRSDFECAFCGKECCFCQISESKILE